MSTNLKWVLISLGTAFVLSVLLLWWIVSTITIPIEFPAGIDSSWPDLKSPVSSDPVVAPPADGFDFPVGPPDAKKYYNAQGFQVNNHLGEDWNGVGGGNTDKGDAVYAAAIGIVTDALDNGEGWGNVVRIQHNIGTAEQPRLIESLYAHLDTMLVQVGDTLQRGQQLGKIGDAHGAYWAHLHFEMRHQVGNAIGGGYSTDTTGFLVPTKFIRAHRPKK